MNWKGKKVTVMGLGLLGRGVGDTAYIAEQGADVIVTDLKSPEILAPSVATLAQFPTIHFVLGEHREEDFVGRDYILKGAGVPDDSPYLEAARKSGARVVMSAAVFRESVDIPMIGVTGTRGKTTATYLIEHVLSEAGKKPFLGGNIRGVSNLQLLKDVSDKEVGVFELDSWQLQGFGEARVSPNISVFTSFMKDHMDYYKGDVVRYFADKAHIFRWQQEGDVLVIADSVADEVFAFMKTHHVVADVIVAKVEDVPAEWHPHLVGEHNRSNAACAYHALKAYGLDDTVIESGMKSFLGVPGRLEFLGEVYGVSVYNDATSTTPDAAIAGIRAVSERGRVVLIAGGADKGLELDTFGALLSECKGVVLLNGTGTGRLKAFTDAPIFADLASAASTAFGMCEAGDVLLFSPGFASFGMFQNEYERNDQFVALVEARR